MADDDKDDFFILKEAAANVNTPITISYAANWLELWRATLKALPDVLFLDLNMPVKDGIECLKLLRHEPKYDNLPIIMYSTTVNKTDIDKAYDSGANYFVIKPYTLDDITNMIIKVVSLSKENLLAKPPREEFVII